ncbi:hypothetical protein [Yeosuana sp.]|uniref:hypothetical protein n=1 Tax=Yeosuana sp. TaxID=2529388 RepID=UPI004049E864
MNTEKLNTIKEIRKVLNEVNPKIPTYAIGSDEREKLEQSAVELESLIWKLVNEDIKQTINELNVSKARLQDIATELKNVNAELKEIGDKVEKASQILGALVNIVLTASSAGLI